MHLMDHLSFLFDTNYRLIDNLGDLTNIVIEIILDSA